MYIMKKLSEVKDIFLEEFSPIKDKFNVIELYIKDAVNNFTVEVNRPGVYAFWHPKHGVIKIGKSQANSKKRALEHIRDNTHNKNIDMKSLSDENDTILLLFNIVNDNDLHWLLSLEAFLEWNTSPAIPADRIG